MSQQKYELCGSEMPQLSRVIVDQTVEPIATSWPHALDADMLA